MTSLPALREAVAWSRRGRPFQPRLTLEHTGYSGPDDWQWCVSFLSSGGRMATGGLGLVSRENVTDTWTRARNFLCAVNAKWEGKHE